MVVVGIIGIIAAMAFPSLERQIEKSRLINAAEDVQSAMQLARTEAVKRNTNTFLKFVSVATPTTTWCYGIAEAPGCDCNTANSCVLTTAGTGVEYAYASDWYPNVTVDIPSANYEATFEWVRGLTADAGTLVFSTDHYEIKLIVNLLGSVKICSDSGATNVGSYETC
jgi:type IV fimbrial biogenesis protein FimT